MTPFAWYRTEAVGNRPIKNCAIVLTRALLLAFGLVAFADAQVRVSQIGSNPLFSAELFPQDMQQWPVTGLIY